MGKKGPPKVVAPIAKKEPTAAIQPKEEKPAASTTESEPKEPPKNIFNIFAAPGKTAPKPEPVVEEQPTQAKPAPATSAKKTEPFSFFGTPAKKAPAKKAPEPPAPTPITKESVSSKKNGAILFLWYTSKKGASSSNTHT